MAFDFSTLITDRSPGDLQALRDLLATPMADWTAEQKAEFMLARSKGAYNYTDLNRVIAAMDDINERLTAAGYVTGYQPIIVHSEVGPAMDANTILLIHGDEIADASIYTVPILNNGVTVSQTQSHFGSGSLYFNGSSYLTVPVSVSGDFTLDFWIFPISNSVQYPTPFNFILKKSGLRDFYVHALSSETSFGVQTTSGFDQVSLPALPENVWTHFAAVRAGGTIKAYFNGVYQGEIVDTTALDTLYLGALFELISQNITNFVGYLDEVRVSNIARWAGNFAPPSKPYDAGSPYTLLPDGYVMLDNLSASGGQYINSGIIPSADTRIVTEFMWTAEGYVFGSEVDWKNNGLTLHSHVAEYGDSTISSFSFTPNVQFVADFNSGILNVPGLINHTFPAETINNGLPLFIFGDNRSGNANELMSGEVKRVLIYQAGSMVSDLIPAKDQNDNVGMYDIIRHVFLANLGAGAFVPGSIVPPPNPEPTLDPYTWYEADVPTESLLDGYLANVAALRAVLALPEATPSVPVDMAELTQAEANAIETILDIIHAYLLALQSIFRRCGAALCGGPGLYPIN